MNCFVDTNLLIYAVDPQEPAKRDIASDLLKRLIAMDLLVLSPQSLSETFHALTRRKTGAETAMEPEAAGRYLRALRPSCRAVLDGDTVLAAIRLQMAHRLQWFDSLLLASALGAACQIFWSEDMQHGQVIAGMRIINPFQVAPAELLPAF